MIRKLMIATLALAAASGVSARELDIGLSDEVAEVNFSMPAGEPFEASQGRWGLGFMYNDDDDYVASGSLSVLGHAREGYRPVQFGAGVKAYGARLDRPSKSVGGVGVGASARFGIPTDVPLAVVVSGTVAPKVTTFGDADRITDLTGRLEAQITDAAHLFAGYRYLRFNMERGLRDERVADGFQIGVRLRF
ncbi:YfaZ precursor [Alkalispirillum mobile]|uniref:YfaZ n=1 Tax=Alkalispirillum mobile TaxID=85925 RepID=A0A498BRF7_9GAMM|nr:YfaZ family outer membrane protein [Alkalispirillum mobile]RLK46535.1 YfaZ precursor [Alkalispirillum mobile]